MEMLIHSQIITVQKKLSNTYSMKTILYRAQLRGSTEMETSILTVFYKNMCVVDLRTLVVGYSAFTPISKGL